MYLLGRGLIGKQAGEMAGPSPKSQPSRCTCQHWEIEKPPGRTAQRARGILRHRGVKVHWKQHLQRASAVGLYPKSANSKVSCKKWGKLANINGMGMRDLREPGLQKSGSLAARLSSEETRKVFY